MGACILEWQHQAAPVDERSHSRVAASVPFLLRTGSFVSMDGLHERQQIMTDFCIRKFKLLKGNKFFRVWLIPSEKSPPFVRALPSDKMPAATPKGRFVVVCGRLQRVSLMIVPEYAHAQGLHLCDFLGCDWRKWSELLATSSHIELCRLIGNAFHTGSAGTFGVGQWLLKRHANFCKDERPEHYQAQWVDP